MTLVTQQSAADVLWPCQSLDSSDPVPAERARIGVVGKISHRLGIHEVATGRALAAMACPVSEDESVEGIKEKSVAIVDCGASSTLTSSLINATDIDEKVATIIETADGEERMRSTNKCNKTCFVRNRMGDPVPISVPALFVRGLPQDLIGGKAINKINI